MGNHKNDLLNLHPLAVVGSLLGARPLEARAAQKDAEPEAYEPRESLLRRLAATFRTRREAAARTQTGRA
jgi:hypothetical protein